MAQFRSIEEARAAIHNPETPKDVYNDILAGNVEIVTDLPEEETSTEAPNEETPQAEQEVVTETQTQVTEDVPVEPSDELPEETPEEKVARLLAEEKEKLRKEFEEKFKSTDTPSQQTNVTTQTNEEPVVPTIEPIEVEVETEDSDLASSYEKGTREILKKIADQLPSAGVDSETLKMIKDLKENQEKILGETEKERERIRLENDMNQVFESVDRFTQTIPELKLPVKASEAYSTNTALREQVAKVFNLTDDGEIEKATRGIIRGESKKSKDMKDKLLAENIEVPDYLANYLTIVEMDEARNGTKFNMITGKTERLELSFEDIYKMQNAPKVVTEQITNAVKDLADTLNGRDNSATSVLDVQVNETTTGDGLSSETDASKVLKYTIGQMRENPKLAQEYADVCGKIQARVPEQVKRLLS